MRVKPSTRWMVSALFMIAALITGIHAERHVVHAIAHPHTRAWLDAAYGGLRTAVAAAFAVFTIGRGAPRRLMRSPTAFAACVAAMGPITIFGYPPAQTSDAMVLLGDLVSVLFCGWLLASVLFLGRCFGVLPAARGLVTRGPYGVVRHPVYLGEIGAFVGLWIAAATPGNSLLLLVFVAGQIMRMRFEEEMLREVFPEYARYSQLTPRILPSPRRFQRMRRQLGDAAVEHP
jgi:protein-S-isoprenylcysteine O-methyltransferase Ste14